MTVFLFKIEHYSQEFKLARAKRVLQPPPATPYRHLTSEKVLTVEHCSSYIKNIELVTMRGKINDVESVHLYFHPKVSVS